MENEHLTINLDKSVPKAELIIRETTVVNELEVRAPLKLLLVGVITAIVEFLTRRKSEPDQINEKKCHVLVDRQNLSMELITNEDDEYKRGSVKAKLELHPKYKEFGINAKKDWDPNELGQFFKMNRAFFEARSENMDLVTKLKNFDAKVHTVIEKKKTESGDFADNFNGVVQSNVPEKFKLKLPLFKGRPAEVIEVEFYASVTGKTVLLQLFSPGANEVVESVRDTAIDEQISKIRELCPDIAIIEQ